MSIIAAKKAQQKKGAETILIYMGSTFLLVVVALVLYYVIMHYGFHDDTLQLNEMFFTPLIYFLLLGGTAIGMGSYLRETSMDFSRYTNWFVGFIIMGILVGAILGAYKW